jgi:hypothetical protein
MESRTLESIKGRLESREALHAYQSNMDMSDAVVQYGFWHLDKKRNGVLSGAIDADLMFTHPQQFIELVMEQVQIDLLSGAARRHQTLRRAAILGAKSVTSTAKESLLAKRVRFVEARAARIPRTQAQNVALKWRAVRVKQDKLAQQSADWTPTRVIAMQEKIADAVTAWQNSVSRLAESHFK